MAGIRQVPAAAWSRIVLYGLPKEKQVALWSDYRWIGCSPSLQKAYLRLIMTRANELCPPPQHELLRLYGFRPKRSCPQITGTVQQAVFQAAQYGDPIHVATADILTAFDAISHELVLVALQHVGINTTSG